MAIKLLTTAILLLSWVFILILPPVIISISLVLGFAINASGYILSDAEAGFDSLISLLVFLSCYFCVSALVLFRTRKPEMHLKQVNKISENKIAFTVLALIFFLGELGVFLSVEHVMGNYKGYTKTFLDVGGWSVILLTSFIFLIRIIDPHSSIKFIMSYALLTCVMSPLLVYGARIDFLSMALALCVYHFFYGSRSFFERTFFSIVFLCVTFWIYNFIGIFRHSSDVIGINYLGSLYFLEHENLTNLELSTIGRIGAGYVVMFTEELPKFDVNAQDWIFSYLFRSVPSFFGLDRPFDYIAGLVSPFGGGSVHSLTEIYLIGGLGGIAFFGGFCGLVLGRLSFIYFWSGAERVGYSSLILMFLFIILFRSGWYQLFSIVKFTQLLIIFIATFWMLNKIICILSEKSSAISKAHLN